MSFVSARKQKCKANEGCDRNSRDYRLFPPTVLGRRRKPPMVNPSDPIYVLIDRDGNIAGEQRGAGGEGSLRHLLAKAGIGEEDE